MRLLAILITVLIPLTLSQCVSYDFARRVTQQGNLLPQEKIDSLRVGMSRNNAAIVMGTSLISPLFNNNRWDYAYTWRRGSGPLEIRKISLFFKGDTLVHIERDVP